LPDPLPLVPRRRPEVSGREPCLLRAVARVHDGALDDEFLFGEGKREALRVCAGQRAGERAPGELGGARVVLPAASTLESGTRVSEVAGS